MFVEIHLVPPKILLKEKNIFFSLALIKVLMAGCFLAILFYSEKKTGTMFTIVIIAVIQKLVEKCIRNLVGDYFSIKPCKEYSENKEEAYRSKEYMSKFMLQKW